MDDLNIISYIMYAICLCRRHVIQLWSLQINHTNSKTETSSLILNYKILRN